MVCCSFLCGCGVPVCVVFHVLVGVVRDLLCGDVWFGVVRGVVCLFVCELFNVCVCFMRVCVLCVISCVMSYASFCYDVVCLCVDCFLFGVFVRFVCDVWCGVV